jgi:hypothetical protein
MDKLSLWRKEIKTAGEARQLAIDWQTWQADQNLSYGELTEYQNFFQVLADKYDLTEEFQENAII